MDLRWAVAVSASLLLAWATGEVNHVLAPLGIAVLPVALAVAYPAFHLGYGTGLAAAVVAALAADAFAPHPWGLAPLVFAALHAALFHARGPIVRSGPLGETAAAALAAACWPLVLTAWHAPEHGVVPGYWIRGFADTAATLLAAAAAAPLFTGLQAAAAALLGLEPAPLRRAHPEP